MVSGSPPITNNDSDGEEHLSDTSNEEYEDALEIAEAEHEFKQPVKETTPTSALSADSASHGTDDKAVRDGAGATTERDPGGNSQHSPSPQDSSATKGASTGHMTNTSPTPRFRKDTTDGAYGATDKETSPSIEVFPGPSVGDKFDVNVSEGPNPVGTNETRLPRPLNRPIEHTKMDLDLLSEIPHLFRILNLCTDAGSNGGIDKVIIDQDGLGRAMNTIREGSYRTVSRINFSALDEVSVRPIGIYGSKSAIVEFLLNLGAVNAHLAEQLNRPVDRNGQLVPFLRSGLYLLIHPVASEDLDSPHPVLYAIYWPEDETWNDNASPSIQKNRVTFMRYLTKLASDIQALVSEGHANAFVWKYDGGQGDGDIADDSSSEDDESDEDDRFVKFEVTKQSDEEEDVILFPGFKLRDPSLACHPDENTRMKLVAGETSQAFMAITRHRERIQPKTIKGEFNATWLRSELMRQTTISLGKKIDKASMDILFELGAILPEASTVYKEYKSRVMDKEEAFLKLRDAALSAPQSKWPLLKKQIEVNVRRLFARTYCILDDDVIHGPSSSGDAEDHLKDAFSQAPESRAVYERSEGERVPVSVDSTNYKLLKRRFLDVQNTIQASDSMAVKDKQRLIGSIVSGERVEKGPASGGISLPGWNKLVELTDAAVGLLSSPGRSSSSARKIPRSSFGRDDGEFLDNLAQFAPESEFADAIQTINDLAKAWLEDQILKRAEKTAQDVQKALEKSIADRTFLEYCAEQFARCMDKVRGLLAPDPSVSSGIVLEYLERVQVATRNSERKFFVHAVTYLPIRASTEFTMTQLEAKAEDMRLLEDDPLHVPSLSIGFTPVTRETDVNNSMLFLQLLNHGRKILQILQSSDHINIYLSDTRDTSFRSSRKQYPVRKDRKLFFAVDEQTRLLALVYVDEESSRSFIQTLVMDEGFGSLQQRGPVLELTPWYADGPPAISDICFFCGSEEICILEESGRIRVFSLLVQAFRPGSIWLSQFPVKMQSSPDGSALLVVERSQSGSPLLLRVFHQATFGQKPDGISLPLPEEFGDAVEFTVSSIGRRSHAYLIAHLPSSASIVSTSLRIKRNEAEYLFRHKRAPIPRHSTIRTNHNSLVDCFSEVWERFPVIPAIVRDFTTDLPPMKITVVHHGERGSLQRIPRYFRSMIRDFISRCQKPTDGKLDEIVIQVKPVIDATWTASDTRAVSCGQWFVELICLIPVHIAVARDNRFVPLKDGMSSDGLSHRLLGSEVADIIDEITLGPYEAILGSYMASKPVRVVSSMGEQSVGKSFSLNHLIDTSFAGSAMRTTEGVWLSLCPTQDQVVIALDFEGVHSLERTAQEDMLLVLFNAAISNLVMFRNNFAFSRNVANMFTSFQAGTRQFDPGHNPTLFKGLLAIIIKDVVDADKTEIVEEFRSKFNEIVCREQGENFITILHDNQLAVMPWDAIQFKGFYTRFKKLSKHLFKQPRTHENAGEFLFTLKTLMAKLTAQDWGAIDNTLIKHRTSAMQISLEQALISGQGDMGPNEEWEALKNYDTQQILDCQDTDAIFYLGNTDGGRQEGLGKLLVRFGPEPARSAIVDLQDYLEEIAMLRIQHVRTWVDSNLARFMPSDNADIKVLQRQVDDLTTAMVANLQLCLNKCGFCQLRCLRPKAHLSGDHDCGTSHICRELCDFCQLMEAASMFEDQGDASICHLPAGHDGRHICEPTAHVCGKSCDLISKQGCQLTCVKPIGHEDDDHTCAALLHQCGQPCGLQAITLHDGQSFSCENACVLPFDEDHDGHTCGDDRSCPVRCELCPRYCATGDHFHGIDPEAIHLCGQDHPCRKACESLGTCEVVQKPESVEVMYRGTHDTFSYTKYTQIARRLNCAIPIPPWQRYHVGQHAHSTDDKAIHHCEAQCSQCGYICHLPYGHKQREHETAHGSMQNTVWAVEDSDDPVVEVDGHRFGAEDSGAPQLCSMYCKHRGRHVHVEFCRNPGGFCQDAESEHIRERMLPQPNRPKDWVSHRLFWARTGFKDPYNREDQEEFARCDSMCPGIEHQASGGNSASPSYCNLPIFHPPQLDFEVARPSAPRYQTPQEVVVPSISTMLGQRTAPQMHISKDGHRYNCPDPAKMIPAFHVIFVLDCTTDYPISKLHVNERNDRRPLPDQPITRSIEARHNNRFGAVLSALYQFLQERNAAHVGNTRRDAYSVLVFNDTADVNTENDTTSSIDQLMANVIHASPSRGSNFTNALSTAHRVMEQSWSVERAPVVIFLSDGEGRVDESVMRGLCNRAVALGTPLSFWSIAFGPKSRVLRAMADIANDVAGQVPRGSNSAPVPSSFCNAIDTVQLAETFSNIATSLRKTRASLINPTAPVQNRSRASNSMLLM